MGPGQSQSQMAATHTTRAAIKALPSPATGPGQGDPAALQLPVKKPGLTPGSDGHSAVEIKATRQSPGFETSWTAPLWCSPANDICSLLKLEPLDDDQQTATRAPAAVSSVSSGAARDSAVLACHGSACVSAFNPTQQTDGQGPSINAWSSCRFNPTVTHCHHSTTASCLCPLSSHMESLPRTNLPQRQLQTCYASEALTKGSQSAEYHPVCETTSLLSAAHGRAGSPRLHQAKKLPSLVASDWLESTTPCCPYQQFSPLSRNNSRNKSRESFASDCQHISPLLSPSLPPSPAVAAYRSGREDCHGKSKRCTKSYVRSPSPTQKCTKRYVRSHRPTQKCTKSGVARSTHSYKHAAGLPPKNHAVRDWDYSHLYWPCKPAEQSESYLQAFARYNLASSAVVGKTDSCFTSAGSKARVRLEASHVSPTSNRIVEYRDNLFAYASGATMCPERNQTGEGSNNACKKRLEAADDEGLSGNHLLGIFTTPQHLTHHEEATSGNLQQTVSAMCVSQKDVLYDSLYSHFQSCFLSHLATQDTDNLPQTQLQSSDATEGHVHGPQPDSAQKCDQAPPPTRKVYRYHRMPLSLPPSELPYPPLSPFHHGTSTQLKKTNGLILSDTFIDLHSRNMLLEAAVQEPLPRSAYSDAFCPLGECNLGLAVADIIKPDDRFAVRSFLENSGHRENPRSLLNLQTCSLRHVLNESALLASEALADKRQIEASPACHFSTQE